MVKIEKAAGAVVYRFNEVGTQPSSIGVINSVDRTPLGNMAQIRWTQGEDACNTESVPFSHIEQHCDALSDVGVYFA